MSRDRLLPIPRHLGAFQDRMLRCKRLHGDPLTETKPAGSVNPSPQNDRIASHHAFDRSGQ